jgi:dolichyl-diphosphooligosaccharide--protein glycosyltransferase
MALLLMAYALGYYLRSLPQFLDHHVLTGDDPYLHLRYAEAILKNGSIPSNDTLRYYPQGLDAKYELPLVSWLIAGFSRLTGLQPIDVAIWLPALFAPLIVIPVFFITRTLAKSTTAGIIAAFLSAAAPGFLIRSFEGFCDKEVFATSLMFAGLALALSSFNAIVTTQGLRRDVITSVALAIASGALIGIAAIGWRGFLFTYLVLTGYALLVTFFGKDGKNLSLISIPYLSILIVSGAFAASPLIIRYGGLDFFRSIMFLIPVGMAIPLIALSKVKRKYVVVIIVILAALLLYVELSYVLGLMNWLFGGKGLVRSTVAESQRPTAYDVWNQVGLPLIFAVFALVPRSLKDPRDRSNYLFLLSLFGVSVALAASETRLLMFLSITVAIMAGDVLSRLMNYYGSRLFVRWKKGLRLNREAAMGLGLSTALTTLAILSLFAIPTYTTEYGPIVSHADVYRSIDMSGYNYWLGVLLWLRENTDQNAIIISWWDYGYLIQYYANRTTVVDPGNVYEWRNVEVAKFFMSESEEESLKILDKSFGLGGREVYVLVSLEEVPKSHAIARIAGSPTPSFQLTQQGWGVGNFNALLTKLVLGIRWPEYVPSLAHFEKVYCDSQYIAIYRIIW